MRRNYIQIIFMSVIILLSSCMIHTHKIHAGALGKTEVRAGQWYCLFGLVPINNVDTSKMAKPHTSYEITTKISFSDLLMDIFFLPVGIIRTTVIVRK